MLCKYCGEEGAEFMIPNPNDPFSEKKWFVCEICKEVIMCQRNLSVCQIIGDKKMSAHYIGELSRLAEKSGKQILSTQIDVKNGNYQEITFGEEEHDGSSDVL